MIHFVFILKKLAIEYNLITNSIMNELGNSLFTLGNYFNSLELVWVTISLREPLIWVTKLNYDDQKMRKNKEWGKWRNNRISCKALAFDSD